jgi:hypothetical protein
VLRAAEWAETMQENIQDWPELTKEILFQLLTEKEIVAVIFLFIFIGITSIIKLSMNLFFNFLWLSFGSLIWTSVNLDYLPRLI